MPRIELPKIDLWQVPLLVMAVVIALVFGVDLLRRRFRISPVAIGWLRTTGLGVVAAVGLLLLVANWGSFGVNLAQLVIEAISLWVTVQSYLMVKKVETQQQPRQGLAVARSRANDPPAGE
jgi:hypothetical protein